MLTNDVRSPAECAIPNSIGPIADMAGTLADGAPVWLVLGENGDLSRWDPDRAGVETLALVPTADEGGETWNGRIRRRRLHASRCGRFVAVVTDYGTSGTVIDLATGRVTMELNGGDGHEGTVPFALAFAEHDGRPVMIHRTDWNRLDVSDPATGALLTERETPARVGVGEDPPHDLDYFHGALYLSPDGTRIYDDGWIWHPVAVPTVWSLPAWLRENVWESEDGPSRISYAWMEEWDRGVVWITPNRIAVENGGDQDQPACVQILDPTQLGPHPDMAIPVMKTVTTFPGPTGRYFTDGTLLLGSGESGLEGWDIEQGRRVLTVPGFRPVLQHQHSLELVEIGYGVIRRWSPR